MIIKLPKKHLFLCCSLLLSAAFYSCSETSFDLPPGPAGMSAYEFWKDAVEKGKITGWPVDKTGETDYFVYIKGEKGDKGDDGKSAYQLWKDMISGGNIPNPHNPGEMWNKDRNTEVDFWDYLTGRDGISPHVGDNNNWWIGDKDTGLSAKGKDGSDGLSPYVGSNGNWWIGITDTGIPAKGEDGKDGANGTDGSTPHIDDNGNWWIGDKDTGTPATGQDGKDGLSAYQSWKELAETGNLDDPKNPGEKWPKEKTEIEHFIQYLTGANGKDGVNGQDGIDGETPYIGPNGNWWIGTIDTGIAAKGEDGIDGTTPHIGDNGNWWIGTTDTGKPAKGQDGKDGVSPHIGDNGNWWIGTTDTGKPAKGQDGSNGTDGKTAYELWIDDVKAGNIKDKDGQTWPATEITLADFWKYLKGKDGSNGTDGKDGVDGKSAYEIWKEIIATGNVDDPKNPSAKWPADKNSETDFWSFLMGKDGADGKDGIDGKDGKSAYELWVEEVQKGLNNPHEPGTEWPKDKTTTDNFWEFLSGKDGKDGIAGKPGEPGQPIEIVTGVPNVISQYALQEYSEYVRWSDGGVLYKVYDNVGQLAPGAKVKGLPGLDPNKEYTADSKGEFIIPKEDLPEGKEVSELVGKALEVTYVKSTGQTVTEASAANTYVPNRVHVRLIRRNDFTIDGKDINIYIKCERHDGRPDSQWEQIPVYLGNTQQSFKAFELSDKTDPSSYNENSTPYYSSTLNLSGSPSLYIKRHHVKPDWLLKTSSPEWDGLDHYYIIRMESYYGEKPILPAVIKSVPIQYVPTIKAVKNVENYADALNAVGKLSVEFDVSQINPDLIFNKYKLENTVSISGTDFEYWVPVKHSAPQNQKSFQINFSYKEISGGDITANNANNRASISAPESLIINTHVLSSVSLNVSGSSGYDVYFTSTGVSSFIGKLELDKPNMKLNFIGTKNSEMNVPDILDIPIQ